MEEKDYNVLAGEVYNVEKLETSKPIKEGQMLYNSKYKVIKTEDNINGMQAMAVVPIDKKGNEDRTQVIIAYAGTNKKDIRDLVTDAEMIGMGEVEKLRVLN